MRVNENNRPIFKVSPKIQVVLIIGYMMVSYWANLLTYLGRSVLKSVFMSALMIAFFYFLAYLVRRILDPKSRKKGILMLTITSVVFPILCYALVYGILPWMHIQLQRPGAIFTWSEFLGRILFVFFDLALATLLYAAFCVNAIMAKRADDLELMESLQREENERLNRERFLGILQSHHLKGNLHYVIIRAQELQDHYIPTLVADFNGVLDYTIDMLNGKQFKVSVERELTIIDKMIASLRIRLRKEEVVHLVQHGRSNGHFVSPLSLVTLVENALKHGLINAENPLEIQLDFEENRFRFSCINTLKNTPDRTPGWGKGVTLVEQSLLMLKPEITHTLINERVDNRYKMTLTIEYLI